MMTAKTRSVTPQAWHRLFQLGMIAKAVDGVLELGSGLALLLLSPTALNAVVLFFVRGELREDPKDLLANLFLQAGHSVSAVHVFAGILLVVHGAVKIGVVAAVARRHRRAYLIAITVFAGFVAYQSYQLAVRPSVFLWVVTILDICVIALIAHEYRTIVRGTR